MAIDECYSDIYRMNRSKPPGGLEAALSLGNSLENLIILILYQKEIILVEWELGL